MDAHALTNPRVEVATPFSNWFPLALAFAHAPTGFWRGAVSESEGTFVAFPELVPLDGATGTPIWTRSGPPSDPAIGRKLDSLELAFSPNARWIAVGGASSGAVTLVDRASGNFVWTVPGPGTRSFGQVRKLRFSADSQFLFCGSGDSQLRKLRVSDGAVLWRNFIGGWPFVNGLELTPDGGWLTVGTKSLDAAVIRAIGPALANFSVRNALADPQLELFSGTAPLASNDNWYDAPNAVAIASAARQVNAFALPPRLTRCRHPHLPPARKLQRAGQRSRRLRRQRARGSVRSAIVLSLAQIVKISHHRGHRVQQRDHGAKSFLRAFLFCLCALRGSFREGRISEASADGSERRLPCEIKLMRDPIEPISARRDRGLRYPLCTSISRSLPVSGSSVQAEPRAWEA